MNYPQMYYVYCPTCDEGTHHKTICVIGDYKVYQLVKAECEKCKTVWPIKLQRRS